MPGRSSIDTGSAPRGPSCPRSMRDGYAMSADADCCASGVEEDRRLSSFYRFLSSGAGGRSKRRSVVGRAALLDRAVRIG